MSPRRWHSRAGAGRDDRGPRRRTLLRRALVDRANPHRHRADGHGQGRRRHRDSGCRSQAWARLQRARRAWPDDRGRLWTDCRDRRADAGRRDRDSRAPVRADGGPAARGRGRARGWTHVHADEQHDEDLFWALRGAGGSGSAWLRASRSRRSPRQTQRASISAGQRTPRPRSSTPGSGGRRTLRTRSPRASFSPPRLTQRSRSWSKSSAPWSATNPTLEAALDALSSAPPPNRRKHTSSTSRIARRSVISPNPTRAPPPSRRRATCSPSPSSSGKPCPPATIAQLVEHLTQSRVQGESRELDFTPWGGAYNRVRPEATAFPHRAERFLLKHEVVVDDDQHAGTRVAQAVVGSSRTLREPAARTRTSPIRTSTRGIAPTTAPISNDPSNQGALPDRLAALAPARACSQSCAP